jgi:hypothetical protein
VSLATALRRRMDQLRLRARGELPTHFAAHGATPRSGRATR